jgi:predicted ATPase
MSKIDGRLEQHTQAESAAMIAHVHVTRTGRRSMMSQQRQQQWQGHVATVSLSSSDGMVFFPHRDGRRPWTGVAAIGTTTSTGMASLVLPQSVSGLRPAVYFGTPLQRRQQQQERQRHFSSSPSSEPNVSSINANGSHQDSVIQWKLEQLVKEGKIEHDFHQWRAAVELDRLRNDLLRQNPVVNMGSSSSSTPNKNSPPPALSSSTSSSSTSNSLLGGFFGSLFSSQPSTTSSTTELTLSDTIAPKGAYLYGGPGCGKTFLMNHFYDAVDTGPWATDKQKVHYHKFMLSVHQQMHEVRQQQHQEQEKYQLSHPSHKPQQHQQSHAARRTFAFGGGGGASSSSKSSDDILPPVIDRIAAQGRLLCLDEFQVTDVADALILRRLFLGLWQQGCVVVATSNRPPNDLYLHGLQRDRFVPFIEQIEQRCAIINMLDSETDYRMMLSANESQKVYFNKDERTEFTALFYQIVAGAAVRPTTLTTQGRKVKIPQACDARQVCKFTFDDLCKKALGAADYLVVGQQYHTVFVDGIPKMTVHELNWLRRFITFVDTMYELRVTLIIWNYPNSIYEIFHVKNKEEYTQDEVFAFDRTLSRLEEMSSPKYLQSQWLGGRLSSGGKIETSLNLVPSFSDSNAPSRVGGTSSSSLDEKAPIRGSNGDGIDENDGDDNDNVFLSKGAGQ